LKKQVRETFPDLDLSRARPWAGLRPATALSKPIIDVTRLRNLWLNVGHGALGFTLACGSARALAALVCGEPPAINLVPFKASKVC
jgi:D-amino-acid dehydrogenase